MLPDTILDAIREEQARQENRFVEGVDFDDYLIKLGERAEILSDVAGGRCRGLVAFYCNDRVTKQAYISLVLVDPRDRGSGLGHALVAGVLDIVRRRGFTSCRLEVARGNDTAHAMYLSIGFGVVEQRSSKDLLEIIL